MILQTAQATQYDSDEGKSEWFITSDTGEPLFEVSKNLTEQEVMNVIKFGRKFELRAYEEGVISEKINSQKELARIRQMYEKRIMELQKHADNVGGELMKLMEECEEKE